MAMLALTAGAAQAQMVCQFEAECFEQDGCMESGFGLTVIEGENGLVFETEFGDLNVVHFGPSSVYFVGLAEGEGARYLLSSVADGDARLSVHLEGPIAVTYLGQCKGWF